jgi:hypothetical protein
MKMDGDFICDGPGANYALILRGHRRLFSDEDVSSVLISE